MAVLGLLVSACAGNGPPRDSFCAAAEPIIPKFDDRLTEPTAASIEAHDETGERLCGWKSPGD